MFFASLILVGLFLGAFVLGMLYLRRRPKDRSHSRYRGLLTTWERRVAYNNKQEEPFQNPQVYCYCDAGLPTTQKSQTSLMGYIKTLPNMATRIWPRVKRLRKRKSLGIKEIISIETPNKSVSQKQEHPLPQPPYMTTPPPPVLSKTPTITSPRSTVQLAETSPQVLEKQQINPMQSSWLLLSPNEPDDQADAKTIHSRGTNRTSMVTIPYYYYRYYNEFINRDNNRIQSQQFPPQKRPPPLRPVSSISKSLLEDPKSSSILSDQDPRWGYFEFDLHVLQQPKEVVLPPRRTSRSGNAAAVDKRKKRQMNLSIATASTAPIFRQHPGEEVYLDSVNSHRRARSSFLG